MIAGTSSLFVSSHNQENFYLYFSLNWIFVILMMPLTISFRYFSQSDYLSAVSYSLYCLIQGTMCYYQYYQKSFALGLSMLLYCYIKLIPFFVGSFGLKFYPLVSVLIGCNLISSLLSADKPIDKIITPHIIKQSNQFV